MKSSRQSITVQFLGAVYISVLIGAFFYSLLVPMVLNYSPEYAAAFFKRKFITVGAMSIIAIFIVYLFYRPIAQALDCASENGSLPEDLYGKAQKGIQRISNFIFIIGVLSYSAGYLLGELVTFMQTGLWNNSTFLSGFIAAGVWGLMNGIITVRVVNLIVLKILKIMKIEYFKASVYSNSFVRLAVPLFILALWYGTFTYYTARFAFVVHEGMIPGAGLFFKFFLYTVILMLFISVVLLEFFLYMKNLKNQVFELSGKKVDLTARLFITSFDDVGIITMGMNRIILNLLGVFRGIKKAVISTSKISGNMRTSIESGESYRTAMNNAAGDMEKITAQQVIVIEETTEAVNGMIGRIEESVSIIDDQLKQVDATFKRFDNMEKGMDAINTAGRETDQSFQSLIKDIETGRKGLSETLKDLTAISETGGKVREALEVIENITARTNVISINAAIEASRAGETGRGFAVVAHEIRKLAEGTSAAAEGISKMMEEVSGITGRGAQRVESLNQILSVIFKNIEETNSLVRETVDHSFQLIKESKEQRSEFMELLERSAKLKTNTESQKEGNSIVTGALKELTASADRITDMNHRITSEMESLSSAMNTITSSIEESMKAVEELDELLAGYKTDLA